MEPVGTPRTTWFFRVRSCCALLCLVTTYGCGWQPGIPTMGAQEQGMPGTSTHRGGEEGSEGHTSSGRARVVDGDSLVIDGERIRLAGIDACEIGQVAERDGEQWRCGEAARSRVIELTGGRDVTCFWTKRDIYERALARCEVAGDNIGKRLVEEGLAVAYRHRGKATVPELAEIEEDARRAGRGLWGGTFETPKAYRKRNQR